MRPTTASPSGSSALTFPADRAAEITRRARRTYASSALDTARELFRNGERGGFAQIKAGAPARSVGRDCLSGRSPLRSTRDEVVPVPAEPTRERTAPLRFAIIGCGAATRLYAAPALARLERSRPSPGEQAVRPDPAASAAVIFGAAVGCAAGRPCERARGGRCRCSSPRHPACTASRRSRRSRAGLHVFCEKPMALTAADADDDRSRRRQPVSPRRGGPDPPPPSRDARDQGAPRGQASSGGSAQLRGLRAARSHWPVSSPRYFTQGGLGRRAFFKTSARTRWTSSRWWCGPLTVIDYADDAMGGVEANASVRLRAGEADVRMRLSRDWERPNLATIRGELGTDRMGD